MRFQRMGFFKISEAQPVLLDGTSGLIMLRLPWSYTLRTRDCLFLLEAKHGMLQVTL